MTNQEKIVEIKSRLDAIKKLEMELMSAGPRKAQEIVSKQSEIQESYYADVSDLLSELERENITKSVLSGNAEMYAWECERLNEDNRKLREERDKLIEGLRYAHRFAKWEDRYDGVHVETILQQIGVTIECKKEQ